MKMEPNNKRRIITIIAFSTLISIVNPVESECVPRNNSYLTKSLTPLFPPSNPPPLKESPAPTQNPPSEKECPAPSPDPPSHKESPAPSRDPPSPKKSPAPSSKPPTQKATPSPSSTPPSQGESTDIKNICGQTDFPPLCELAVTPLLAGKKPDAVSFLQLAIQASTEQTKTAVSTVEKLSASPDSATTLQDCKDVYDDALSNLQQAADAVESRDMGTVNSMLSAALTDYSTCDDGFVETDEHNPVAGLGDKLMKMASNCLAIASLIK